MRKIGVKIKRRRWNRLQGEIRRFGNPNIRIDRREREALIRNKKGKKVQFQ